jgi:hypothetical protein
MPSQKPGILVHLFGTTCHLNGSNSTLGSREAHECARLSGTASAAHDEYFLNLPMLRKYLQAADHLVRVGACMSYGEGTPWNAVGNVQMCITCCSVASSVPGGAPPTKSLFSGLGLERPTFPPPTLAGGPSRGCMSLFDLSALSRGTATSVLFPQ